MVKVVTWYDNEWGYSMPRRPTWPPSWRRACRDSRRRRRGRITLHILEGEAARPPLRALHGFPVETRAYATERPQREQKRASPARRCPHCEQNAGGSRRFLPGTRPRRDGKSPESFESQARVAGRDLVPFADENGDGDSEAVHERPGPTSVVGENPPRRAVLEREMDPRDRGSSMTTSQSDPVPTRASPGARRAASNLAAGQDPDGRDRREERRFGRRDAAGTQRGAEEGTEGRGARSAGFRPAPPGPSRTCGARRGGRRG